MMAKLKLWFDKFKKVIIIIFLIVVLIQLLAFFLLFSVNIPLALTTLLFSFLFDAMIILSISKKSVTTEILLISFFVLVLSSPLVYAIVFYIEFFLLPDNPEITVLGSQESWITFAGSVISGVLVLLALTYTIQHQKEIRDEDKKNELLPLIEIDIEFNRGETNSKKTYFNSSQPWYLTVNNIGDNPLRDLKVIQLEAWFYNNESDAVIKVIPVDNESVKTNLIAKSKFHEIELLVNEIDFPKEYYNKLRLHFYAEYKDLTLKNTHYHSSTIELENCDGKIRFSIDGYKEWNKNFICNNFID